MAIEVTRQSKTSIHQAGRGKTQEKTVRKDKKEKRKQTVKLRYGVTSKKRCTK
jgi:hypothetical protein